MSRQEAEIGSAASEYLTVPELAKVVRRNRKTVYGWIATGQIGEADGLFVVYRRRDRRRRRRDRRPSWRTGLPRPLPIAKCLASFLFRGEGVTGAPPRSGRCAL